MKLVNQKLNNLKKIHVYTHTHRLPWWFLNSPANSGDTRNVGSIPGSGISPGAGNGNPLQYSCLENSIDRGAWQATIHVITK